MPSESRPHPIRVTIAAALLLLGAVLTLVTVNAEPAAGCVFCVVTVAGATAANAWAGGMLGAALLVLGFGMVSGRKVAVPVWLLLGAGLVASIVALAVYADGPLRSLGESAATIAATSIGLIFLYLVFVVLLLGFGGVLPGGSGGGAGKPLVNIPAHEEDQHVHIIEGIGPKYASRLNAHGIITVPQLLQLAPAKIAAVASITSQMAGEWQGEGRLMQVKGIGPQFAEILAMTGLRTVKELAESDVDALLARVDAIEARRKTRVLKVDVQRHHIEKFVQAARQHLAAGR